MVLNLAILLNLIFYALIVSQHLFYLIVFTTTSVRLSAPAYVEVRNQIDDQMQKRGPFLYYAALGSGILLLGLSVYQGPAVIQATSVLALLALILDIRFSTKGNIPINSLIKTWTPSRYPSDWEQYRAKWLQIFGYRQVILGVGFLTLLFGAVFKSQF